MKTSTKGMHGCLMDLNCNCLQMAEMHKFSDYFANLCNSSGGGKRGAEEKEYIIKKGRKHL